MFDIKMKYIPLSEPEISGNEWKYIKECLDTGWVSSVGNFVDRLELIVARYVGSRYAVATVNGTAALHVSLIALAIKADIEVIVPTLTFVAPVNAVRYCLANPVFMDCDSKTLCIDVEKVNDFLVKECRQGRDGFTYNKATGRKITAIIPVHVFGHPADMGSLCKIAQKYNICIIEDATESLGSQYKDKKTGSIGDVGCLSFNGNKIMTTGSGGMVVTDNRNLAKRIRHLTTQAKKAHPYEYGHDEIGYNYRLTNIQAALGVAQMEQMAKFLKVKRENAILYRKLLAKTDGVDFIWEENWAKSNLWFYTIRVNKELKNPLIRYMLSHHIQVRPIWKPIHTLPMYREFQSYAIENTFQAYDTCVNLPCSVSLKAQDVEFVVKNINDFLKFHKRRT